MKWGIMQDDGWLIDPLTGKPREFDSRKVATRYAKLSAAGWRTFACAVKQLKEKGYYDE